MVVVACHDDSWVLPHLHMSVRNTKLPLLPAYIKMKFK
jgi:hypothetical protein